MAQTSSFIQSVLSIKKMALTAGHVALLSVVLISGCGQQNTRPDRSLVEQNPHQQAEDWIQSGQYQLAAAYYKALFVEQGRDKDRDINYLIKAAELLAQAQNVAETESVLAEISSYPLDQNQRFRIEFIHAELALLASSASEALAWLTQPESDIPKSLRSRFYQLQGLALAQLGAWMEAALAYQKSASWLADDQLALPLYDQLFAALGHVDGQTLRQSLEQQDSPYLRYPEFQGWIAFVQAVRASIAEPENLVARLERWREVYPLHPASIDFLERLQDSRPVQLQKPSRLALLLPLKGRYRAPAKAVEQAILASRFLQDPNLTIDIFPMDESADQVLEHYQQAIDQGADWVVGPLLKHQVSALSGQHLPVPVLALNQPDSELVPTPGLYRFSLNPEDEARYIAQQMWQRGIQRVLTLHPEDARGLRVETAFAEAFAELGGVVAARGRYNPVQADHSKILKRVLELDLSHLRKRRLQRLVGQNLHFEEQRRDDIDGIFLFANPEQARQIRPQLAFHRANALPVYATSSIFSGAIQPEQDRDLNGMIFCDIPWLHHLGDSSIPLEDFEHALPNMQTQLSRFYALGLDILPILNYLDWMQQNPDFQLHGASGSMKLLPDQRIDRETACLKFKRGKPQLLQTFVKNTVL